MTPQQDYALDKEDDRDYIYKDFYWIAWSYVNKKIIDKVDDYQDQSLDIITKYMCVFFSSAHGTNIENNIEGSWIVTNGIDLGLEAITDWTLDPNAGAYIVDWPKLLLKKWLIKWYALVKTIEEIKHSIANNRPVVCGSNRIIWGDTAPYILKEGKSYGHAVVIIWYDDEREVLIIKNSYWKDKYDKWKNYLLYKDFWLLYNSKYSLLDKKDDILSHKRTLMNNIEFDEQKILFSLWIYNGKDNNKSITRGETAIMIERCIEKIFSWEITAKRMMDLKKQFKKSI